MASTLRRPVGHDDRLSLVEHLDELRSRLIVCASVLLVSFMVCAWQNGALLNILNEPLERATATSLEKGRGLPGQLQKTQLAVRAIGAQNAAVAAALADPDLELSAAARQKLQETTKAATAAIADMPITKGNQPVTLRVGEPFMTTLTVALYFALLFAMPLLLYQLYAFVLPAFSPEERRVALPLMSMVPVLFITGVVFGYFVVLPPATQFLQNFNSDAFNVLVQANDYYKFAVLALAGLGLLFQLPVAILAATRVGIVTPLQLRKNRRYSLLIIAVVAMLLPGTDPVTMLISMAPLLVLYEASIWLAVLFNRGRPQESVLQQWRDEWGDDDEDDEDLPEPNLDFEIDEDFLDEDDLAEMGARADDPEDDRPATP
ncbi:twin-arginine translocase subunit TatC [Conexibacter sp. W3-3-2]|uniref:Sec-independent protein translocase protein TatC n=1 Tax=Paraconexibacter algicola TaxID=2133960 RepID=A0A2T4UJ80_9ACTN|nr:MULTISPECIES: twin-arginine translocase subunit TatC [Solirubrobacterales]MTD45579.1 twin-arginine translocase subunit TatC [Conexibacter sp. W3-3-2]PTL59265.1 twin-arginine translocase subunit TatC [Paraconexibacter algicola]